MNQLTVISSDLAPEVAVRLQAWVTEAKEALSESTLHAYAVDGAAFRAWCASEGQVALPASPETVARFLRSQSVDGKAVATIRRRLSTISGMHKAAGFPNPCEHELVKLAMKGVARNRGTDQRQAAALTERDAITIRAHLTDSTRDVRDLALMLVGRDLLTRSAELVALEAGGIEWNAEGAVLTFRRRKTSTEGHSYFIGLEAATALRAWLERAVITEGPIFRSVNKAGGVSVRPLGTRDLRRILKARAVSSHLAHGKNVSGHSL